MLLWSEDIKLDSQDYEDVAKADISSQSQHSSELGCDPQMPRKRVFQAAITNESEHIR